VPIVQGQYYVNQLGSIAMPTVPGEFEMEAMGAAAFAVLTGAEPAKVYEGKK
jgi:hypothetical protein